MTNKFRTLSYSFDSLTMNAIELILNTQGIVKHTLCVVFLIIVDFMTNWSYNAITTSHAEHGVFGTCVWYWLVWTTLDRLIYICFQTKALWTFETNFELAFRTKALEKYSKLNQVTRTKEPLLKYNRKLDEAINLFTMINNWGVYMFLNVMSTMSDVCLTFGNDTYVRNTIFVCLIITGYLVYMNNLTLSKEQKECRKKKENIQNQIVIAESYFELGKKDCSSIIVLLRQKYDNIIPVYSVKQEKQLIMSLCEISLNFVTIFACMYGTISFDALNALRVIIKVSNNLRYLSNFFSSLSDNKDHWSKFTEFWKENEENLLCDPVKQDFPEHGLTVANVDYERNTYTLKCNKVINLSPGSVFKLKGETAAGKSTFCDLIQGKDVLNDDSVSGLTFSEGNVRNFTHHICECSQECSGRVKWDISTLRQHFAGEEDDELIYYFCMIVCIDIKVRELGLDIEIDKRVSGGEQQRITLASNLHFAHVNKSRIIIFDEPEKGLGALAEQVINNIIKMEENKNNVLIISTHDPRLSDDMFSGVLRVERTDCDSKIYVE